MRSRYNSRYGRRKDAIHPQIVAILKKANVPYWDVNLDMDLVVGAPDHIEIWELKSDEKSPLKPSQVEFLQQWYGYPVYVIRSVDEAKRRIGIE